MIDKTIHYVWIGGKPKSKLTEVCINSWRRVMPEYSIIEWNETNIDIEAICQENAFFRKCYKYKLWAFVSDYLRLKILYENGGIYFDTDVEAVKPFDDLLDNQMFLGTEHTENIAAGVIGAVKGHPLLKQLLDFYEDDIWNCELVNSPAIYQYLLENKPDLFSNCTIYPVEYFYEYFPENEYTQKIEKKNTYSNHWYTNDWNMTRKGYVFLNSKSVKNPILRFFVLIKKNLGFFKRKYIIKEYK